MTDTGALKMKFDRKTIDHLGIKLYSSFPPVIAELISNSYDADAEDVVVSIDYTQKIISVSDTGNGMVFEELRDAYLVIGRNRREENGTDQSPVKKRLVTGKKGLGKLAVFGVANIIEVSSVKDGKINSFIMNYNDIRSHSDNDGYPPTIVKDNVATQEPSGTVITISEVKTKSLPPLDELAIHLSKRFKFFNESDFRVVLKNTETGETVEVKNEAYYDSMEKDHTWKFPEDFQDEIQNDVKLKLLNDSQVEGVIYTKPTPLQNKDVGFVVYSRGKLVQENGFFSDRANDNFYRYTYGYFSIDVIDASPTDDFVGTARRSVLWEQDEDLVNISEALDRLLNIIQTKWRKLRADTKQEGVKEALPEDFYDDIPSEVDKKSLQDLEKSLVKNSAEDEDPSHIASVMKAVKVQFRFETFKSHVSAMNPEEITPDSMEKLSSDWYAIETQELAKVATGRIETIDKFEQFIQSDASETKHIQPFLEKFPWILEPRMTTFDREVTFSQLLKQEFPDDKLEESNRRIDFLCSNVNGEIYIIELKRPGIKLSVNEIMQARRYATFLKEKRPQLEESKINVFLISDRTQLDREAQDAYDSFHKDGKLTIKSYTEMLEQARQYHDNFIDAQKQIEEAKSEGAS